MPILTVHIKHIKFMAPRTNCSINGSNLPSVAENINVVLEK